MSAIVAADNGKKVTILSKTKSLLSGNTPHAQGGIIFKGMNESPELLKADILNASAGSSWNLAIEELINNGSIYVKKWLIDRFKIPFDKIEKELHLTTEAAHSEPRIIHVKDQTGKGIQKTILGEIENNPNINFLTNHFTVDLLTLSHHSKNTKDILSFLKIP